MSKQQPSELICTVPDPLARVARIEENHEILDISGTHATRTAQFAEMAIGTNPLYSEKGRNAQADNSRPPEVAYHCTMRFEGTRLVSPKETDNRCLWERL
jgi:hypothetical protein